MDLLNGVIVAGGDHVARFPSLVHEVGGSLVLSLIHRAVAEGSELPLFGRTVRLAVTVLKRLRAAMCRVQTQALLTKIFIPVLEGKLCVGQEHQEARAAALLVQPLSSSCASVALPA